MFEYGINHPEIQNIIHPTSSNQNKKKKKKMGNFENQLDEKLNSGFLRNFQSIFSL